MDENELVSALAKLEGAIRGLTGILVPTLITQAMRFPNPERHIIQLCQAAIGDFDSRPGTSSFDREANAAASRVLQDLEQVVLAHLRAGPMPSHE